MIINNAFAQAAASTGGQGLIVQLLPLILIFVVFYFLLIRPQQKRVKQHKEMVNSLKVVYPRSVLIYFRTSSPSIINPLSIFWSKHFEANDFPDPDRP